MNFLRTRSLLSLLALALASACGPGNPNTDAGPDARPDVSSADAPAQCRTDNDCTDGVFCDGAELCAPGDPSADARGCVIPSQSACRTGQTCDESNRRCVTNCSQTSDADGDGHRARECGGDDCDDADFNRAPGRTEVCDARGHDEDCDTSTFGTRDGDGDGVVDALCCNSDDSGNRHCGADCDDMNPRVHPSAQEICNGLDDDCNGRTDEGLRRTYHRDADGDRFGTTDTAGSTDDCSPPPGYVESGGDCDDARADRNPGAPEVCDGADNDCDGMTDEGLALTLHRDADGDLFGSSAAADAKPACGPVTGYVANGTDCDDAEPARHPGAPEVCDGLDNDCDGMTDEGLAATYYRDADGDGFGTTDAAGVRTACTPPAGYALGHGDCDDAHAAAHPGGTEICDGLDNNCNGTTDEDPATVSCTGPHGASTCVAGRCQVNACAPGYGDCDNDGANGCETDTAHDANHCGTCATACGTGGTCDAGVCDRATSVALGAGHACALRSGGRAVCWGTGTLGQLGDGSTAAGVRGPSPVAGIVGAVQIASGKDFTCARLAGGAVWCWGDNAVGQLGRGAPGGSQSLAAPVAGLIDAVDLAAGDRFACAARRTGEVWCWGRNDRGQLGAGDTADAALARPVHFLAGATSVAAGAAHACAVRSDGVAVCWGDNTFGQLGGMLAADTSPHPTLDAVMVTPAPVVQLTAGAGHTCARLSDVRAWCWGDNSAAQLGDGDTAPATSGAQPTGSAGWVAVRAGARSNVAIEGGGGLRVWGDNTMGQLGDAALPAATTMPASLALPGGGDAIDAAVGADYGCAVQVSGEVDCWGSNAAGQLGDGTRTNHPTPTRVPGL